MKSFIISLVEWATLLGLLYCDWYFKHPAFLFVYNVLLVLTILMLGVTTYLMVFVVAPEKIEPDKAAKLQKVAETPTSSLVSTFFIVGGMGFHLLYSTYFGSFILLLIYSAAYIAFITGAKFIHEYRSSL